MAAGSGEAHRGTGAALADFDLAALHAALDEQRQARGLSWQGTAREISQTFGRARCGR